MAERRPPSDSFLAEAIGKLADRIQVPDGDRLPAAVSARLRARPLPDRRFRAGLRLGIEPVRTAARVVLLAAALVVVLAVAAAAAAYLVRGVVIVRSPVTPTVAPTTSPVPLAARLDLGKEVSLARAAAAVDHPLLVPTAPGLGTPDAVFLNQAFPLGQVSLVYRPRPGFSAAAANPQVGLLVTEVRADVNRRFLEKMLGPDSLLESVEVRGARGYFIHGAPHEVLYVSPSGEIIPDTVRLAGNVLLWESGGVTYRIEGDLPKVRILAIASSMR